MIDLVTGPQDGVVEIVAIDLVLAAPSGQADQRGVLLHCLAPIVDARAVHELEERRLGRALVPASGWRRARGEEHGGGQRDAGERCGSGDCVTWGPAPLNGQIRRAPFRCQACSGAATTLRPRSATGTSTVVRFAPMTQGLPGQGCGMTFDPENGG